MNPFDAIRNMSAYKTVWLRSATVVFAVVATMVSCSQKAPLQSQVRQTESAVQAGRQASEQNGDDPAPQSTRLSSSHTLAEIAEEDGNRQSSEAAKKEEVDERHRQEERTASSAEEGAAAVERNAESMIESKLFKSFEEAYFERNQELFMSLYKFYLDSFPKTPKRSLLDSYVKSFYYSEQLHTAKLRGALLEIEYPKAKSWVELDRYFANLRSMGIDSVQIAVVQLMGVPVFLFTDRQSGQGYYFNATGRPIIDNALGKIVKTAHDNRLKVLVSLPLRHHPLIGYNSLFIVDESWNFIQHRTNPNSKLDLLNPNSQPFLVNLIDAILATSIDGIVFKDDFTYRTTEGFSEIAQKRYKTDTGRYMRLNEMFVPVKNRADSSIEVLATDELMDVAIWRSRQIKQLLWELIAEIRKRRANCTVGIEVTPEMIVQEDMALKWYSTNLQYLRDLRVDFFKLNWQKFGLEAKSDRTIYREAFAMLRDSVDTKTAIYAKIALTKETRNTILLNRRIESVSDLQRDYDNVKLAIGAVNRFDRIDLMEHHY